MILKRPYAFFIKMFKPIHLLLAIMIAYLMYLESKILGFFNIYIYSSSTTVSEDISKTLVNNLVYIIPFIVILFSLIILGIMFRKKKPVTFYVITIFAFLVVTIINFYAANILKTLENSILAIGTVKLIYDLMRINIVIESITFIFFIVRGIGINFKKFNFDAEISKFEVNESDKEEFELDINVDLDESKRKRKRNIRYLKYAYLENKFLINCISIITICLLSVIIYSVFTNKKVGKQGIFYSIGEINLKVENTTILNTDFKGKKITDNYLVVLNVQMGSNYSNSSIYLNDMSLNIGDAIFKPTTEYYEQLLDLGITYNKEMLTPDYRNYLIVYEITEKYINSEMILNYKNLNNTLRIKLQPNSLNNKEINIIKNLNEEIIFSESLGNISFNIKKFEISDKFTIDYNYCITNDDCIPSIEYLTPSINQNFDKTILKINVDYNNDTSLNYSNFYSFFNKFGSIYYKINDTWYYQNSKFEEIKSTKKSFKNIVHIGVNKDLVNASDIKIVFNVRNVKYEYILRGES